MNMTLRPLIFWNAMFGLAAIPAVALCAEAGQSVWAGVYTSAQADRGADQYQQHCASCHGDALGGSDAAPPLAGSSFLANWNGQTAGALFTRIKTTMPFDNPNSLTSAEVTDIEAMILARNEFPAGSRELPADPAKLRAIAINQNKPGQ
jgi:mono/diheme cytochrome c family protein